jgi:hypothetical protein
MGLYQKWIARLVGILLLAAGTSANAGTHQHVQSESLHAAFDIGAAWHQQDCGELAQGVACMAFQTGDSEADIFYVWSKALPLDEAMMADGLFEKDGKGGWVKSGRMGNDIAQPIEGKGWKGWRATADCGIQDENGVHDAGECMTVFASDGQRTIIMETEGTVSNEDVLSIVVSTLALSK